MDNSGKTIAFIGCGNMGSALLLGLLDAIHPETTSNTGSQKFKSIIACTNSEKSAEKLKQTLGQCGSFVQVLHQQNQAAIEKADVVVLGFKPFMAKKVLQQPGIQKGLAGKLVISLLAGLSVKEIQTLIAESEDGTESPAPYIAKAIPNLAARYQQSMTILEQLPADFPPEHAEFLNWMFFLVGRTKFLDESLVDVGSVLVTTCVATLTVPIDGILDGSVVEGFKRQDALELVTQGVAGLGSLLSNGSHPAVLREQVSSPKGTTIQTLVTVERQGCRATFTDALLKGTEHLKSAKDKK
ncbi:hypothetical protein NM208_g6585 [Fusarium decemcellulare]|uniref:Uncharacterized protein n=1 Tax=Fusarium decemcellulare TaxID=57161 RepID=A0ACC1SCI1_9HYPO|nr:hypothetical protein NM208_g6585 [Fusarium decemcellulare]